MSFSDMSLGEDYPYWKYIQSPTKMGISSSGKAFTNDVKALLEYPKLLIEGNSRASATGHPLGNQYFLKTGGQCCDLGIKDSDSGKCSNVVDRYIYVDNIPDGSIPFISNDTTSNNSNNPKGILIGILEDVGVIGSGVGSLFTAFTSDTLPTCRKITLQVTNNENVISDETQYVADTDINDINSCKFTTINPYSTDASGYNNINPVSCYPCGSTNKNQTCLANLNGEAFSNIYNKSLSDVKSLDNYYPSDPFIQLYYFLILILGLYIFYKLVYFSKK